MIKRVLPRSVLHLLVKTLKEMGFEKVFHVEGGFGSMQNSGFKVIK